jgi:hypothetical protein
MQVNRGTFGDLVVRERPYHPRSPPDNILAAYLPSAPDPSMSAACAAVPLMGSVGSMGTMWADSVRRSLDEAVVLLGAVVEDCPDELWRAPMWRVQPSEIVGDVYDDHGVPISDPAHRDARIQRWSHPWSVAWHALEVLDYDLAGELVPWAPPPPFAGNPHWRTFTSLPVAWSHSQIAGYVDHCRQRIRDSLDDLTEDQAATPLPASHRYAGKPYAWVVTSLIGHTTAHAMQIRQFTGASERPTGSQAE